MQIEECFDDNIDSLGGTSSETPKKKSSKFSEFFELTNENSNTSGVCKICAKSKKIVKIKMKNRNTTGLQKLRCTNKNFSRYFHKVYHRRLISLAIILNLQQDQAQQSPTKGPSAGFWRCRDTSWVTAVKTSDTPLRALKPALKNRPRTTYHHYIALKIWSICLAVFWVIALMELTEYPPSVEADKNLLPFESFDEYLDSLIGIPDLRNLRSIETARTIAALGYRTCGDTLEEREFYRRRAVIHAKEFPVVKPIRAVSAGLAHTDPLNKELADREKANRLGILNSVIFIRNTTRSGFEVSGYIDIAHRLATEDWEPFFRTSRVLRPRETDLGYYFWRLGIVRSNVTRNWKPLMDGERGLVFQNRHDHKLLAPDPQQDPGQGTTRVRVFSPRYLQVEIYDHVVRRKT